MLAPISRGSVSLRRPIQANHSQNNGPHRPHVARGSKKRCLGRSPERIEPGHLSRYNFDEISTSKVPNDGTRVALIGGRLEEHVPRSDISMDDGMPVWIAMPAAHGIVDAKLHVSDSVGEVLERTPDKSLADASVLLLVLLQSIVEGAQIAEVHVYTCTYAVAALFEESMHVFVDIWMFARAYESNLVVGPLFEDISLCKPLLDADLTIAFASDLVDAGVEVAFVDHERLDNFELLVEVVLGWTRSSERHADE